jgi:phage shock protein PspC (stress-responsive transcriptional regulator)
MALNPRTIRIIFIVVAVITIFGMIALLLAPLFV